MKKINLISMFVLLIAALVLSACGSAATPAPAPAANPPAAQPASQADSKIVTAIKALDPNRGAGKTIGVVAFFQANDWNRNALQAIKDNLEKYKYTVNVIDGNGDAAKMNAAIDTHIANKVSGIIIAGGDGPSDRRAVLGAPLGSPERQESPDDLCAGPSGPAHRSSF